MSLVKLISDFAPMWILLRERDELTGMLEELCGRVGLGVTNARGHRCRPRPLHEKWKKK